MSEVKRYVVRQMDLHPDGPNVLKKSRVGPRIAVYLATDYDTLEEDRDLWKKSEGECAEANKELEAQMSQLRHDRDVLAENLTDVRAAVWRTGMNATLQRHNDDRLGGHPMSSRKIFGCALVGAAISAAIVGMDTPFWMMFMASIPPFLGLLLLFWEDTHE